MFTFKGRFFYKTTAGAILSLIFVIIMLLFGVQLTLNVLTEKVVSVNTQVLHHTALEKFNPALNGF
jgi:hypothetical protein